MLYDDLCFDAQQAAEKAIKAILVSGAVEFPKTHDIAKLLFLVSSSGVAVPDNVREGDRLTRYAAAGRYPGLWEDTTESEYVEALRAAEYVVSWAESVIAPQSSPRT